MNKLFQIMEGIDGSDYAAETFASIEAIVAYAENGCDITITDSEAARIQAVALKWRDERENGNGEWSQMRHEAMAALADD